MARHAECLEWSGPEVLLPVLPVSVYMVKYLRLPTTPRTFRMIFEIVMPKPIPLLSLV
jgi:hypothetical protein